MLNRFFSMKIVTFIILFFCSIAILSAQKDNELQTKQNQSTIAHCIGVSGGGNISVISEPAFGLPNLDFMPSWQIMASYEYRINQNPKTGNRQFDYGFRLGIGYIGKGHDIGDYIKTDETGQVIGEMNSQGMKNYLIFPINACIYYKIFYLKGGLYGAKLLDVQITTDGKTETWNEHSFETFDLGIDLGAGINFNIFNNLSLSFGYTFQQTIIHEATDKNTSHLLDLGVFISL